MSFFLSVFEHAKLEAYIFSGVVTHTHYVSDPTTGQRRVSKTKMGG